MLVDVVRLRRKGEKLPAGEIRAAVPVRGILSLGPGRPGYFPGQRDAPLLAGLVEPGSVTWCIPPLDQARVTRIRAGSMVIVGIEEEDRGRGNVLHFRQAWWVRVADGHDRRRTPEGNSGQPRPASPVAARDGTGMRPPAGEGPLARAPLVVA